MNSSRSKKRSALTLMELLVAVVSATLLMAMLASTIRVANRTLDVSIEDVRPDENELAMQRIRDDLQYATAVNLFAGHNGLITRPTLNGSGSETITYDDSYDPNSPGLLRQVTGGPSERIQTDASVSFQSVDGYSGPTVISTASRVQIRAVETAEEDRENSKSIPVPLGTQASDWMLLFAATRSGEAATVDNPGWQLLLNDTDGNLHLSTYIRSPTNDFSDVEISIRRDSDLAAAIVAIDIEQTNWAILDSASEMATSSDSDSTTWSAPEAFAAIRDSDLNIQAFAATGAPWETLTLGIPGFVDVARINAGGNSGCTLAVVARSGPVPELGVPIRVGNQEESDWHVHGFAIGGDSW